MTTFIFMPLEYVSVLQGKRTRSRYRDSTGAWVEMDNTLFGEPATEDPNVANRRAGYGHPFTEDELNWIKLEISRQASTIRSTIAFTTVFPYSDSRGELYDGAPVLIPAWRFHTG